MLPEFADALRSGPQFGPMVEKFVPVGDIIGGAGLRQFVFQNAAISHVRGSLSLLNRHTRFQPGEDVQPSRAPVLENVESRHDGSLHRDGSVRCGYLARRHSAKTWLVYTDHDKRLAI